MTTSRTWFSLRRAAAVVVVLPFVVLRRVIRGGGETGTGHCFAGWAPLERGPGERTMTKHKDDEEEEEEEDNVLVQEIPISPQ